MQTRIGRIENGINLDHLPVGSAWYIIKLLKLEKIKHPVGIGLNLNSTKLGRKDLIKIEEYILSPRELELISIFAMGATYSEIKNYAVVNKFQINCPDQVADLIICPNHRCVSHQYKSLFHLHNKPNGLNAKCHYCENSYELSKLTEFKI